MTAQITADAAPTVVGKRFGAHGLLIACPFYKGPRGAIRYHEHGTGYQKGPVAPARALQRSRLIAGIAGALTRPDRPMPQLHHLRRGFARRGAAAGAEQRGRTRSLALVELQDDAISSREPCGPSTGPYAPNRWMAGSAIGSAATRLGQPASPLYK